MAKLTREDHLRLREASAACICGSLSLAIAFIKQSGTYRDDQLAAVHQANTEGALLAVARQVLHGLGTEDEVESLAAAMWDAAMEVRKDAQRRQLESN